MICKQFNTPRRIILSGSPLQNRLKELWSLFDFVYPGKLGTLPVFEQQFSVPIALGGYASASVSQAHTAYKCATTLKNIISPYLLRRLKNDVAIDLPKKNEHILFCKLTLSQVEAYKAFLLTTQVRKAMTGDVNLLAAVTTLRKICNHPDILRIEDDETLVNYQDSGSPSRSGKMAVLEQVLGLWRSDGSRVLIFSQTTTMLDIIEKFIRKKGFEYRRMDGKTGIAKRSSMIDEFNSDEQIYVFLLTTKVGGLGVNLTGANKVVLYDPDWNPSTDLQARERAWRVGQKREVSVYRLITTGTIEEKIYHRQVYKTMLSDKVLKDAKQRRIFRPHQVRELFTLDSSAYEENIETETGMLFGVFGGKEHRPDDASKKDSTYRAGDPLEPEDCEMQAGDGPESNGDGKILQNLFDNVKGLHAAVDHDAILLSSTTGTDVQLLEYEATRVAEEAEAALRRSREARAMHAVGVPTWTGQSGHAGAVPLGPTARSGAILEKLRARSQGLMGAPGSQDVAGTPASATQRPEDLMEELVGHLRVRRAGVTTSEIAMRFGNFAAGKEGMILLKSVLKKVAKKDARRNGETVWTLKGEYVET